MPFNAFHISKSTTLRVLSPFPGFQPSQGTEEAERKLVARCIDQDPSAGGLLDLQPEAEAGSHNVAGPSQ